MLLKLLVLLIIIGLFTLICGLSFKLLKINKKAPMSMLESISSRRVIQKLLNFLPQDKAFWTNKLAARILELSEVGISLQQMYLLKIISFIVCAFLVVVISYTNTSYQTRMIIESSEGEKAVLFEGNSYDQSKYVLYKHVVAGIGKNKLSNASETDKYHLVGQEMGEYLNTADNQLLEEKTEWFIKTWREVQRVRIFKYYHILILLMALILPEFILTIRWLLRGCIYKKEIIKLEYIFELLARVDGIKTLDIIHELEKSSKIYAKYLHEFAVIFQYDKKKGFEYLKNRNIKSLTKMSNVLEVYSLSDKAIALQVLEREVMERDESIIITAEETIDFIDLVAFLSIVPMVYELARLMLNPMLDIVYKAFEFI